MHNISIGAIQADGSAIGSISLSFFSSRLTVLQLKFFFNCKFRLLIYISIQRTQLLSLSCANAGSLATIFMRHFIQLILLFLFHSVNSIAQSDTAIISRLIRKDTSQNLIIRDCMQGDLSYYLNGEKVDMRKTFLGVDKIINIKINK